MVDKLKGFGQTLSLPEIVSSPIPFMVLTDTIFEKDDKIVTQEYVLQAKKIAKSLEQQVVDRAIEQRKEYRSFRIHGEEIGVVNGLAVLGVSAPDEM